MSKSSERTLLVLVAVLLGLVGGLLTGILVAAGHAEPVAAVLAGGGGFLAVVPLVIGIQQALGLYGSREHDGSNR